MSDKDRIITSKKKDEDSSEFIAMHFPDQSELPQIDMNKILMERQHQQHMDKFRFEILDLKDKIKELKEDIEERKNRENRLLSIIDEFNKKVV